MKYRETAFGAFLVIVGYLLATVDVEAAIQQHENPSWANILRYSLPFIGGLLFYNKTWLTVLAFWTPQAIVYWLRWPDPLVMVGIVFSFILISILAVVGSSTAKQYIQKKQQTTNDSQEE